MQPVRVDTHFCADRAKTRARRYCYFSTRAFSAPPLDFNLQHAQMFMQVDDAVALPALDRQGIVRAMTGSYER